MEFIPDEDETLADTLASKPLVVSLTMIPGKIPLKVPEAGVPLSALPKFDMAKVLYALMLVKTGLDSLDTGVASDPDNADALMVNSKQQELFSDYVVSGDYRKAAVVLGGDGVPKLVPLSEFKKEDLLSVELEKVVCPLLNLVLYHPQQKSLLRDKLKAKKPVEKEEEEEEEDEEEEDSDYVEEEVEEEEEDEDEEEEGDEEEANGYESEGGIAVWSDESDTDEKPAVKVVKAPVVKKKEKPTVTNSNKKKKKHGVSMADFFRDVDVPMPEEEDEISWDDLKEKGPPAEAVLRVLGFSGLKDTEAVLFVRLREEGVRWNHEAVLSKDAVLGAWVVEESRVTAMLRDPVALLVTGVFSSLRRMELTEKAKVALKGVLGLKTLPWVRLNRHPGSKVVCLSVDPSKAYDDTDHEGVELPSTSGLKNSITSRLRDPFKWGANYWHYGRGAFQPLVMLFSFKKARGGLSARLRLDVELTEGVDIQAPVLPQVLEGKACIRGAGVYFTGTSTVPHVFLLAKCLDQLRVGIAAKAEVSATAWVDAEMKTHVHSMLAADLHRRASKTLPLLFKIGDIVSQDPSEWTTLAGFVLMINYNACVSVSEKAKVPPKKREREPSAPKSVAKVVRKSGGVLDELRALPAKLPDHKWLFLAGLVVSRPDKVVVPLVSRDYFEQHVEECLELLGPVGREDRLAECLVHLNYAKYL